MSLRELLGLVGAHEWRVKGIAVPAAGGRIHPHYGVFAPVRREYVDLVAEAPLSLKPMPRGNRFRAAWYESAASIPTIRSEQALVSRPRQLISVLSHSAGCAVGVRRGNKNVASRNWCSMALRVPAAMPGRARYRKLFTSTLELAARSARGTARSAIAPTSVNDCAP